MAIEIPRRRDAVRERALPTFRQRERPVVAQANQRLAQGIATAAQGAADLHRQVRDEQDTAAVKRAHTEYLRGRQHLMNDESDGILHKRGKNAIDSQDDYMKFHDEVVETAGKELNTERQRQMYRRLVDQDSLSYKDALDRHVAKQSHALSVESAEAHLDAMSDDVIFAAQQGPGNEMDLYRALRNGEDSLEKHAELMGWTPEILESKRAEWRTGAMVGAMEQYIESGNVAVAEAFLSREREGMDESVLRRSKIEKVIQAKKREQQVKAVVDRAWADAISEDGTESDPRRAEEIIRNSGLSVESQDAALERLANRVRLQGTFRREADSQPLGRVETRIIDGTYNRATDADYERMSDEGKARADRMARAAQRARRSDRSNARRIQNEHDRFLMAWYDGLDLKGEEGYDKVSIDIEGPPFDTASPTMREMLRGKQKGNVRSLARDTGINAVEFRRMSEEFIQQSLPPNLHKKAKAALNAEYERWRADPQRAGVPPSREDIAQMFADSSDAVLVPGRLWGFNEMTQLEAQARGYRDFELVQPRVEIFDGKRWVRQEDDPESETEAEVVSPDDPSEGQTYTDPSTGETAVFRGGRWVMSE